jgi:hypothetical protein
MAALTWSRIEIDERSRRRNTIADQTHRNTGANHGYAVAAGFIVALEFLNLRVNHGKFRLLAHSTLQFRAGLPPAAAF